jgi:hypothetical protein
MKAILCTLAAFALLAVVGVSAASASPPTIYNYGNLTFTFTITNVCPAPYTVTANAYNFKETDFFYPSGVVSMVHDKLVEQDSITGPNGVTLTSNPYSVETYYKFDTNGNETANYGDGVAEGKILLPDGSTFFSAGRIDFVAAGNQPTINPNVGGHSGNIAALCTAIGAN